MLIPISPKAGRGLIPTVPTMGQYRQAWGNSLDVLPRLIIAVATVLGAVLLWRYLDPVFRWIVLIIGLVGGSNWLWGPAYWASLQNGQCGRYAYRAFWRGNIVNAAIGNQSWEKPLRPLKSLPQQLTVGWPRAKFPNRPRSQHRPTQTLNLEIRDESGLTAQVTVTFRRPYRLICPGDWVEMVVLSHQPNFGAMVLVPNLYLPDRNLWMGDYPLLRRQHFLNIRRGFESPISVPDPQFLRDSSS